MFEYRLAGAYPPGTIIASAHTIPPAAQVAHDAAFAAIPAPRGKPWVNLSAPPPGAMYGELVGLHRQQVFAAIAKRLGKRVGGNFAGAVTIDLMQDLNAGAVPHLFLATTRFRAPYRFEDRIDVAVMPCTAEVDSYFARGITQHVATWAWDKWSLAPCVSLRVVINKFGQEDRYEAWGMMRPLR